MKEKACCSEERKKTYREAEEKKKICNRLNRIEGQVKGIKKMVEEDRYCNDILMQLSAIQNSIQNSIQSLSNHILERHLYTCVSDHLAQGDLAVLDELTSLFKRFH